MTKKLKPVLAAALLVAALFALAGCNLISLLIGRKPVFEFASPEINVRLGAETTPEVVSSADETYTLESSDPEKVEIVDGVRIRGAGLTTGTAITATSGSGKTAECVVKVEYADIEYVKLETADGNAVQLTGTEVTAASPITFLVRTNDYVNPAQAFSWTVTEKETGLKKTVGGKKKITFTPEKKGVVYVVTVTSKNGLSDSMECGFFDAVYLTFRKDVFGLTEHVLATMVFRLPQLFKTNPAPFTVTVNGTEQEELIGYTEKDGIGYAQLDFGVRPAGEYRIKVSYLWGDLYGKKESNEVFFTVKELAAIDRISVSVESGSLNQRGSPSPVRLRAVLSPATSEVKRTVWYVNGEAQSAGEGRRDEFTFTPPSAKAGEYHITATADRAESRPVTVVYRPGPVPADGYVETCHYYGGYEQNAYITSQEEMNNIVRDALERQRYDTEEDKLRIYVDYDPGKSIQKKLDEARASVEESGNVASCEYTNNDTGEVEIRFDYTLEGGERITREPSTDADRTRSFEDEQEQKSRPFYAEEPHERHFYIDEVAETIEVDTSNMLYKAVSWGYKPKISPGSGVSMIYANARTVLSRIITDDMTEYEKVRAIYDWIVFNVRYDDDLARQTGSLNDAMKCNGYYLEGVFKDLSDPHAVCDGKSKAFALMCGIEGIKALRITGKAVPEGNRHGEKTGHAWNKVLLDPDEDGLKDWYLVDTTWGDVAVWNAARTVRTEYLTHAYFLLRDAEVSETHEEDAAKNYPEALGVYDYYAEQNFTAGSAFVPKEYDHRADSRDELKEIVGHAKKTGAKFIEVRMAYDCGGKAGFDRDLAYALEKNFVTGNYSEIEVGGDVYCVVLS